jgi:transposase
MERREKKSYTQEFKIQALELAQQMGNFAGAARQLGISDSLLYSWKEKYQIDSSGQKRAALSVAEAEECRRLRKENEELKKVNYILKRAAAFFSQDLLK